LQQLFHTEFKVSKKVENEGLRIFSYENKTVGGKWLILASSSRGTADQSLSENFVAKVVGRLSNVVIFVVNDLSVHEQSLINQVQQISSANRFIVVHNLKGTEATEKAKNLFHQQIESLHHVEDPKVLSAGKKLSYQKAGDSMKKGGLSHYGFAKETGKAGKEFNAEGMNLIRSEFKVLGSGLAMKKDEKLSNMLAETYQKYLQEIVTSGQVKVEYNKDKGKMKLRVNWGDSELLVKDDSCPHMNVFERRNVTSKDGVDKVERVVDIEAAGLTSKDVKLELIKETRDGVTRPLKCVLEMNFERYKDKDVRLIDTNAGFRPGKKCKLDLPYCFDCSEEMCAPKDPCHSYNYGRKWENFDCNADTKMEFEDGMLTLRATRCSCKNLAEGSK
jgi:hypothetical protein